MSIESERALALVEALDMIESKPRLYESVPYRRSKAQQQIREGFLELEKLGDLDARYVDRIFYAIGITR